MLKLLLTLCLACYLCPINSTFADHIQKLQTSAVQAGEAEFGHWGWDAKTYLRWGTHSNRLVPVYTFGTAGAGEGIDLNSYSGPNSLYRSEQKLKHLYSRLPEGTLNSSAEYVDQTDIYNIQKHALATGKKNIILVVFDGMDWQTTQAASIAKLNHIAYESGRGTGLHFQDYQASGTTQFAAMVTSPMADNAKVNVNDQTASPDPKTSLGGYIAAAGGDTPWDSPEHPEYLLARKSGANVVHSYTDSASSATSMTSGIKTYNAAINVTTTGKQVSTIAHQAQQQGYKIGVVTSVPISHATPAAAYAHNVKRHDYQDLTNDLLGVKSISHSETPLSGVDVLLGCGYGESRSQDSGQGENFVAGNAYLTDETRQKIDVRNGGKYQVVIRTPGVDGAVALAEATDEAITGGHRLFGFFGVKKGHLPYQTADGKYNPPIGRSKMAEQYSTADLKENPTLAQMTASALSVLEQNDKGFWLMVEAGDVDWANHDNNLDNSIGAVFSGDAAVKTITDWVEKNSSWDETIMIVTADHGHFLVLEKPELLVVP